MWHYVLLHQHSKCTMKKRYSTLPWAGHLLEHLWTTVIGCENLADSSILCSGLCMMTQVSWADSILEDHSPCSQCISYFSYRCDQIPDKKQYKGEEFILAYSVGRDAVHCGGEGLEAVSHIMGVVRKQREINACAQLTFFFLYSAEPYPPRMWGMVPHKFKVGFPCPVKSPWKRSGRHTQRFVLPACLTASIHSSQLDRACFSVLAGTVILKF